MISVIHIWVSVMIISIQATKKYSTAMCYRLCDSSFPGRHVRLLVGPRRLQPLRLDHRGACPLRDGRSQACCNGGGKLSCFLVFHKNATQRFKTLHQFGHIDKAWVICKPQSGPFLVEF